MTKPLPILVLLLTLAGAILIAQQQPAKMALSKPGSTSFDAQVEQSRTQMFEQGKQVFRSDTFGDEAYWGDTLQLHRAIAGEKNGGVGPGVSPKTALSVGLIDLCINNAMN
jgi:hypothetical protein